MTVRDAFVEAMRGCAAGVTVVTVRDDDDDLGITATSFTSVSADPPLVGVGVARSSYLAEVLDRQDRFAVSVLAATQRSIASRFTDTGRPSARLLLADLPHHRGGHSAALVVDGGVCALECTVVQRIEAGDHLWLLAAVVAVDHVTAAATPLIRVAGRYG